MLYLPTYQGAKNLDLLCNWLGAVLGGWRRRRRRCLQVIRWMWRLAPAARKPGNILDRSHRIPNIGGDGCRENIQFRMPHAWNCMGMWARAKQGGNAYSTVKKYSKLPKTHPDIEKYIRNKHCSFILYFSGETYYMLLHREKFRLCAIFLEKVSCWFPHDVFDVFFIVFQARQVWSQPV